MPYRIRIINPNSNSSMTDSLRAPIDSLNYNHTEYTYLTGPASSPHSINNLPDAQSSTTACLPLLSSSPSYDANLIACYSPHPLVSALHKLTPSIPTIGIFEASVGVAIRLLASCPGNGGEGGEGGDKKRRFGIVSTGVQWKDILERALGAEVGGEGGVGLGTEGVERWCAGVECVGVDAGDLHPGGEDKGDDGKEQGDKVKEAVMAATGRLLARGDVGVVILGCAGMVGMEEWVREEVARRGGEGVRVVDGVKAGVGVLQGLVRGGF